MNDIKIYKKIEPREPVMIAGWPGMGSVASGVVSYLVKKLKAEKFAEVEIDPLLTLDAVQVENGLATLPPPPKNTFYYSRNPELVLFEGESQVSGQGGVVLLNKILDFASQLNVKTIYTGAAFPMPLSHKEAPQLYGAANRKALISAFTKLGVAPMDGGHISGLNGLIMGFARDKFIDAVCILATMPQYAISLPNPKASFAIIETLQRMLRFKVDLTEMEEYIRDMDEKMAMIEDKVKDVLTVDKDSHQPAPGHTKKEKVPAYIVDKIEKLFVDAKSDKAKAIALKKELDRWDLYHAYEDRFLDLFKDKQ